MAFTDLGSLGAIGNTNNNQTTLDLVTSAAIAVGDFVVVVCAADNIANGGDDGAVTGVTIGIGGQALTKGIQIANALAAQAGASCSIWYGVATSGLASGGTIRATFGSATLVDASAMVARKFSIAAGTTATVEGTPTTLASNANADPGGLTSSTANITCLRVRGIASQVGNNTNLTPTASWTAWANGNSATTGTVGEICARAESRISTGTGDVSDPTYVSAIYASAYVAFKETLLPISGTLVVVDSQDIANFAGVVTSTGVTGTLATVESRDVAYVTDPSEICPAFAAQALNDQVTFNFGATAYVGTPPSGYQDWGGNDGTLVAVENRDTANVAGGIIGTGTLATVENRDTANLAGGIIATGTLTAIDSKDVANFAGNIAVTGTLAVVENRDTANVAGVTADAGPLAAIENRDIANIAGVAQTSGPQEIYPAFAAQALNDQVTFNFGATAYAGTAPSGYQNWDQEPSGVITGTLAVTENRDVANFAGSVVNFGTLSVTENRDVASFAGSDFWSATLAATENRDTANFNGGIFAIGTLTVTENRDVVSFAGSDFWLATLAVTENRDAANFNGGIFATGALAVTEPADAALFSGFVVGAGLVGSLSAVEAADGASLAGQITGVSGTLVATEAKDIAALTGIDHWVGALAVTENRDTASFVGAVLSGIVGNLVAIENADSGLFAGQVTGVAGRLTATESADTAAFAGASIWLATLATTEARDVAAFFGGPVIAGTLAATEAKDVASFAANNAWQAILVATENRDAAAFVGISRMEGILVAVEPRDSAAFNGFANAFGTLVATEGRDVANFTTAKFNQMNTTIGKQTPSPAFIAKRPDKIDIIAR
jgi:hypothetical protein